MKEVFKNKAIGFRLTLVCIVFSLVTAAVYASIYSSTRYMSWAAVASIVIGVVLTAGLILAHQYRFAPTALMVCNFLALLFYIYYIYFFISSVVTGIQFSGFPLEFYVNIVFFAVMIILSVVCVFLPQTNE